MAILISLILYSNFVNILFFAIAIIIVFLVGLLDDLLDATPSKKTHGQLISIIIIIILGDLKIESFYGVWGIYELPEIVSFLFTIFVFVVIINSVNLIDGIDGLAAGIGSISAFLLWDVSFLYGSI